jgi:hypothetical protein
MNLFRTANWHKKATVVLVLLGLLLQVQTVFACQMMDHSGPIEHCCCGEMAAHKQSDNQVDNQSDHDQTRTSACCDISSGLSFKAGDLENEDPIAIQSHSAFELPPAALVFLLVSLWPETAGPPSSPDLWDLDTKPGSPGTATYLSTLRLRI